MIHILNSIKEASDIYYDFDVIFISPKNKYLPKDITKTSEAGMDLTVENINNDEFIKIMGMGVKYSIPEGFELQLRLRSKTPIVHHCILANSVGTLDSSYRGEIKAEIYYLDNANPIKKDDSVCQIILSRYYKNFFTKSNEIRNIYLITNEKEYKDWSNIISSHRGEKGAVNTKQ